MKTCDRFTAKFSEYLDERLSITERADLEAHVRSCASCAEDLRGLRRAHDALLVLGTPLTCRPALASVRERIRQDRERAVRNRWLWAPVPVAGAALAGLLAVSFVWRGPLKQPVAPVPESATASRPAVVASVTPSPGPAVERAAEDSASPPRRVRFRRPHFGRAAEHLARRAAPPSALPAAAARVAPVADVAERVMVVTSRPALNYCAVAHDPVSGAQVSEVSVRRTYGPDGSVRANIVLHFPDPDNVEKNDADKSI